MRAINLAIARYYAWRHRWAKAAAMRRYHRDDDWDRRTRRLIKTGKRYAVYKKTSEKFFSRAKGRV